MNACEPLVRRQVRGDKKSTWLVKNGEVAALINHSYSAAAGLGNCVHSVQAIV